MALDAHTFEREHVPPPSSLVVEPFEKKSEQHRYMLTKSELKVLEGCGYLWHRVCIVDRSFSHEHIPDGTWGSNVLPSLQKMRTMPKKKLEVESRTGERQV
jgi:hypothetical protein